MKRGLIFGIIGGLIAVAILGFLVWKIREGKYESYNTNVSLVRDLQRNDAAWTVEALKARLGLVPNYDAVASYLPEIRALRAKLQNSELAEPEQTSQALKNGLDKYFGRLQEKEDYIERFKSGHAILRNSLRYMPQAGQALIEAAEGNSQRSLAASTRQQLTDIFLYLDNPTEEQRAALASSLDIDVMTLPPVTADTAANFLSHANLVLEQKEPVDNLLAELVDVPSAKAGNDLLDLYAAFQSARVSEAFQYQIYLMVYTGILLLLSILFGLRFLKSYGAERRNEALAQANRELESKVDERTRELETAIRQLKSSQAQLVHTGRMAAVGQLVAGVAHEINTPLGYLHGNVETLGDFFESFGELTRENAELDRLLKDDVAADDQIAMQMAKVNQLAVDLESDLAADEAKQLLADMVFGIDQISEIVKSLKDFSRIDRAKKDVVDLNETIDNTLRVVHNLIKKHAEVVKKFDQIPSVVGSASQINQVLLNLLTNAAHAIEQKGTRGTIVITTRRNQNWAQILIQDNGIGMDNQTAQNIMEPFFTTKEAGKGTGLGLSICQNIIQEHGGHIQYKSVPGKGTVFQISLPIPTGKEQTA